MVYTSRYQSPLGSILLAADGEGLRGLWFEGQKHFAQNLPPVRQGKEHPLLLQACRWADIYFSGREPDFSLPLHPAGTAFQQSVWECLCAIPYGKTVSYGEIAARLAAKRGVPAVAARAVGAAVGRNPVSLLIPCHRVLGADGSLTGYAAGLDRKRWLLRLEGAL